jgi:hypothetical protein
MDVMLQILRHSVFGGEQPSIPKPLLQLILDEDTVRRAVTVARREVRTTNRGTGSSLVTESWSSDAAHDSTRAA